MPEWRIARVSDLELERTLLVQDGNHGNDRPRPDEFVAEGVVFVRAADLDSGRVRFERASRINNVAFERVRKGRGRSGDILFSHKGTVGKVALVDAGAPEFVCSPQTTFWRSLDKSILDGRYLYFFLQSPAFVSQVDAQKGETDMAPYVSLTQQRNLRVVVPPIAEQQGIADVLGALDDKIAANTALGTAADQLMRAEYSGLSDALRVRVDDVAVSSRDGVDPSTTDPTTVYVGLEHMPRRNMWLADHGNAMDVTSGKSWFQPGDVLFGKLRPYFHKVVSAPLAGMCSTDVLVVRAKDPGMAAVLLVAVSSDDVIDAVVSMSEGTRMPRTSWKDLAATEITWPNIEQAQPLGLRLSAIQSSVQGLLAESRILAAMRDALLPQLMSGKLRVRDAEGVVGDVL